VRRLLPILALLVVVPVLAGCGGTQTAEQKARKEFLFKYPKLDDQQLAKLCPGYYPTDFLNPKRSGHYHYTKDKASKFVFSATLQADATRVPGCKGPGTTPKN
jgi:hypothetical protein